MRAPLHPRTAAGLRTAHANKTRLERYGQPVPLDLATLDRDYRAWRARVQTGGQPDTPAPPRGRVILP